MSKARFYIYRNLKTLKTSNSCSVRVRGKVIHIHPHILCEDVNFVIQPAGQKRAREQKQRNVHAFVAPLRIHLLNDDEIRRITPKREITYNPFKTDTFIYKDTGEPVSQTDSVIITGGKIYEY